MQTYKYTHINTQIYLKTYIYKYVDISTYTIINIGYIIYNIYKSILLLNFKKDISQTQFTKTINECGSYIVEIYSEYTIESFLRTLNLKYQ